MLQVYLFFEITQIKYCRGGSGVLRHSRNSRSGGDFPHPKKQCVHSALTSFTYPYEIYIVTK